MKNVVQSKEKEKKRVSLRKVISFEIVRNRENTIGERKTENRL